MKSVLVIRPRTQEAVISRQSLVLINEPRPASVSASREVGGAVIMAGQRGPQGIGIPGPAGGSAVQRTAGVAISALCIVYELDGSVFPLDQQDDEHIDLLLGLTLTAAQAGQPVNVQLMGAIDDSGWSFSPGSVWLGANGALTQIPPVGGYDVLVGSATSATRLILNPEHAIDLE